MSRLQLWAERVEKAADWLRYFSLFNLSGKKPTPLVYREPGPLAKSVDGVFGFIGGVILAVVYIGVTLLVLRWIVRFLLS